MNILVIRPVVVFMTPAFQRDQGGARMELKEHFASILDGITRDVLTARGRWLQHQGDACAWGPMLLFSLAEDDLGLPLDATSLELAKAGKRIADRTRRLAAFFPLLPRLWVDTLMGVLGMYRADACVRDGYYRNAIERVLLVLDTGLLSMGTYPEKARMGPIGPTVAAGVASVLNLLYGRFYYTRPIVYPIDYTKFGLEILDGICERALHPDGYFLEAPGEDGLNNLPNAIAAVACVLAWEAGGREKYLEIGRTALDSLETLRDEERGGYFSSYPGSPGGDFKELSFLAFHLLALVFMASVGDDGDYLARAGSLADSVLRDLLRGGRLRHHWHEGRASNAYCAGCNLHFLYCLYLMFNLQDNGILIDEIIETDAKSPLLTGIRHPILTSTMAIAACAAVRRRRGKSSR